MLLYAFVDVIRTGQTNEFDVALLVILSNAREAIYNFRWQHQ